MAAPAGQSIRPPNTTGIVCAVLMPHAPVLVPGVGGERGRAAANSCRAMRAAAKCLLRQQPESVLLLSPHSPRQPDAFGLWADDWLHGSFAELGAPQVELNLPPDQPLAQALTAEMHARDLATWRIRQHPLDHGALVPLWFLVEAGWDGPTLVLGLNQHTTEDLTALGEAIAAAADQLSRRLALVASGDLSHRLLPEAPCGFNPRAHLFDETFMALIRAGSYRELENIAPDLRELAAEDAVDSTLIATAAVNWENTHHEVLNYEGPFGVGYGIAVLFAETGSTDDPATASPPKKEGAMLPAVARRAVAAALRGTAEPAPLPSGNYLNTKQGVFVTIRQPDGNLRGCVGTFAPKEANIVAETWRSARLAALQDNRFNPVTPEELDSLRFEVSVLHSLEEVSRATELDPRRYGVLVSVADGRRGLLLPGITEIQTPEQQLRYAREKAGIGHDEPLTIQRFQVDRFSEPAG